MDYPDHEQGQDRVNGGKVKPSATLSTSVINPNLVTFQPS